MKIILKRERDGPFIKKKQFRYRLICKSKYRLWGSPKIKTNVDKEM